jgi:hypothetical protein
MAQPQPKSSPLNDLCSALPSLPAWLQQVGRFVAANDYDATTRSMRDLAAEAGADPASFTRLAKALGYSGWDELRAALTEARRPAPAQPFSARTRAGRKGPHAEISLVADWKPRRRALRAFHDSVAKPPKIYMPRGESGRQTFEAAAACAQLSASSPAPARCNWSAAPTGRSTRRFPEQHAVVVIGTPYSRPVLSARAAQFRPR